MFFLYKAKQSNRLWKTKTIADTQYEIQYTQCGCFGSLHTGERENTYSVIIKTICVRLFIVYFVYCCCFFCCCLLACMLDNGIFSCIFRESKQCMHVCAPKRDRLSVTLLHCHSRVRLHLLLSRKNVLFYWDTSNDMNTEKKRNICFFFSIIFFPLITLHFWIAVGWLPKLKVMFVLFSSYFQFFSVENVYFN